MAERKPQAIPVSLTESADKKSVVWTKNIVEYDFMQYLSGKKLTAAEWNMLLVRIVQQGNYTADSLKEFIEVNLPVILTAYDADTRLLIKNTVDQMRIIAEQAKTIADQAKLIAEQAKTIATNSVYSISFENVQDMINALNGYDNARFNVGNSIYLKQKNIPDMWVYAIVDEYIEYVYTTDYDFVNTLLSGTVQIGYYILANLESKHLIEEPILIRTADWVDDVTITPYVAKAIKTIEVPLSITSIISPIFDAIISAKYGIIIGALVENTITYYAMIKPEEEDVSGKLVIED